MPQFPSPYSSVAANTRTGTMPGFSSAAYGKVPTPTAVPQSIFQETGAADPGLMALNDPSNKIIGGQLKGQLSPETLNAIKDNAATFGVSSGMPGAGLANNLGLRNLGLNVEALQNQGLNNYMGALKTIGGMQLDPSLVSSIGTYNNQLASAPDPAAAAAQEEALWQQHYRQTQSPAGATGSGPTTITGAGLGFRSGPVGSVHYNNAGGVVDSPYQNSSYNPGPATVWSAGENAGLPNFQDPYSNPEFDPYGELTQEF